MAKLHIHPVGLILLLLGLASWVVALGGLAASVKFCNDNSSSTDIISCTQEYQQDWWGIVFEILLLLTMLFTCFLNIFPKAQYIYMSFLVMVTGLITFTTKKMLTRSFNQGWLATDQTATAYNAAGAGCIMLCMVNYGLMIFIGYGAAKMPDPAAGGFANVSNAGPPTGMGNTDAHGMNVQMGASVGKPMAAPPYPPPVPQYS